MLLVSQLISSYDVHKYMIKKYKECQQHRRHFAMASQHTEVSRVKARRSEPLDLPDTCICCRSLTTKSVWYSTRNVLISTVSNISIGSRSNSVVYSNNNSNSFRTRVCTFSLILCTSTNTSFVSSSLPNNYLFFTTLLPIFDISLTLCGL